MHVLFLILIVTQSSVDVCYIHLTSLYMTTCSYTLDSTVGALPKQMEITLPGYLFTHLGFPECSCCLESEIHSRPLWTNSFRLTDDGLFHFLPYNNAQYRVNIPLNYIFEQQFGLKHIPTAMKHLPYYVPKRSLSYIINQQKLSMHFMKNCFSSQGTVHLT